MANAVKGRLHLTVLPQTWHGSVPRSECADGPRPCKYKECRHHLWSEITTADRSQPGRYGVNGRMLAEAITDKPSCAIDVADDGPKSLQDVATILVV